MEQYAASLADPEPLPALVSPVLVNDSRRSAVNVKATFGEAPALLAPSWSGTVTSIPENLSTDGISSLDIVVEIDGISRLAFFSERPFFRPLSRRSVGADVIQLHALLVSMGLMAESHLESDTVGWPTVVGIRELATQLGHSTRVDDFDPSWVVWLPTPSFDVAEVHLRSGGPAPSPGTIAIAGVARLLSIELLDEETGQAVDLPGAWNLAVEGVTVQLIDGVPATAGLQDLSETGYWDGDLDRVLSAVVELASPLNSIQVPASSIRTNANGQTCIWIARSSTETPELEARRVVLGPGGTSSVSVIDGVSSNDLVLANPASYLDDSSCPSS
ncbi:MAG: hypothetical protein AAGA37_13745 [Actinomycetota bacterium]